MASEIVFLKKSKIKLLYNLFLFFCILFIIISFKSNQYNSKYTKENTNFIGKVINYQIDGDQLNLELKAKERINVYYYLKTEKEKQYYQENLELGQTLQIIGELTRPNDNYNLYAFNYRKYLLSKNIKWILTASKIKIIKNTESIFYKMKNNIISRIQHFQNKEYLQLFILGKNELENDIKESYSKNGISHLFAISGMHISLITILLSNILQLLFKNKKTNLIFVFLFLLFFLFLTDFSPSVLRATSMYILCNISFLKNVTREKILITVCIIMLIINPYYIYHLGFVFSYTISFFLIHFRNIMNNYNHYFQKLFVVSMISFLASLPIMIYQFHSINILSIIMNLFFVPFVSFFVFPISLITFIFPILEPFLNILIQLLQNSSLMAEKISFGTIILKHPSFYMITIYYIVIYSILKFHKQYIILLLIMIIIHHNINYLDNRFIMSMIYIGQGDSILIKLPNNKGNILFDTGGKLEYTKEKWQTRNTTTLATNTIIPYLKAEGISNLDYLILTHADQDHAKESIPLINNFKVNHIIMNRGSDTNLEKQIIQLAKFKKIKLSQISQATIKIKNWNFYFLNDQDSTNENEDSLITYIRIKNRNILLTGDAGEESENHLLQEYNLPKMDILKVGHHGSKNSSSEQFIKKIKPKYAFISAGIKNRFHHPHQETLENLKKYHSNIFTTSKNGMIKTIIQKKIYIQTCF